MFDDKKSSFVSERVIKIVEILYIIKNGVRLKLISLDISLFPFVSSGNRMTSCGSRNQNGPIRGAPHTPGGVGTFSVNSPGW